MKKLIAVCTLLLIGCAESPTPILGCEPSHGMTPDCRFHNPEDMAVLGDQLLVSQMGSMDGAKSGDIVLYSPLSGDIEVLFPPTSMVVMNDRGWGDETCPPPDLVAFSPHGIDLEQRSDGRLMLLVVNHGQRESVEFFEVLQQGDGVALAWRGCASGPDQAAFNDVVAKRDGGFWVTQMMPRDSQMSAMLKALLFGSDTGFVYQWDAANGFSPVAGSDGPFPNGIEKSADESHLFINMYLADEVRKLDLGSGKVVAAATVASPDNITWSRDGRLLVASHTDGFMELTACQSIEAGSCGFGFEIVALNPNDMSANVILANRGAPMGGATVAVEFGDELFLGTFAGDRIARIKIE
ncbi:MAG: SMP-30/gluconolactonase/LRE family protein [Gammaproteobacteria bacterium]|nr:SMP-30/gluconolactonase/LRE family protein [Gammaproteobacteria bacterium]